MKNRHALPSLDRSTVERSTRVAVPREIDLGNRLKQNP
jgi:hypothetical protein